LVKEHGRGNNATNEASYDLVQLGLECISRLENVPLAYDFTERFDEFSRNFAGVKMNFCSATWASVAVQTALLSAWK